ncbi:hypothetical protein PoB_005222600 [Plakobranchus ocellatus]|uniref:Uncharacterized protein n=1 Tax=Plakobranchus ocellatus TaxID=259542 RepID=A0AAV4BR38_9GAST|nr:hypothetical protein PoB_005222600 [Plakobranchus ocellatus]
MAWFLYIASPQQGDSRLSGPPSSQGDSGGVRARNRRVPADLRAESLATVPPTPPPDDGSGSLISDLVGGMKAVIWIDFFQNIIVVISLIAFVIQAALTIGSWDIVVESAKRTNRWKLFECQGIHHRIATRRRQNFHNTNWIVFSEMLDRAQWIRNFDKGPPRKPTKVLPNRYATRSTPRCDPKFSSIDMDNGTCQAVAKRKLATGGHMQSRRHAREVRRLVRLQGQKSGNKHSNA